MKGRNSDKCNEDIFSHDLVVYGIYDNPYDEVLSFCLDCNEFFPAPDYLKRDYFGGELETYSKRTEEKLAIQQLRNEEYKRKERKREEARLAKLIRERKVEMFNKLLEESGYVYDQLNNNWYKGPISISPTYAMQITDEQLKNIIVSNEAELKKIMNFRNCDHDIIYAYSNEYTYSQFRSRRNNDRLKCSKCGWIEQRYHQRSLNSQKNNDLSDSEIRNIKESLSNGLLKKENVDYLYGIFQMTYRTYIKTIRLTEPLKFEQDPGNTNWFYVYYKNKRLMRSTSSGPRIKLAIFESKIVTKIKNKGTSVPIYEEVVYEICIISQKSNSNVYIEGDIYKTIFTAKTLEKVMALFLSEFEGI